MFATPIPRPPPAAALEKASAQVAAEARLVQASTNEIIMINRVWMRIGVNCTLQRGGALVRQQQASARLAGARAHLTALRRAHALSLFTELHSVMKRKQLSALRARSWLQQ